LQTVCGDLAARDVALIEHTIEHAITAIMAMQAGEQMRPNNVTSLKDYTTSKGAVAPKGEPRQLGE
jgi:hypothetical protein